MQRPPLPPSTSLTAPLQIKLGKFLVKQLHSEQMPPRVNECRKLLLLFQNFGVVIFHGLCTKLTDP